MDTNEFENVVNEPMSNEIKKKNNSGIIFAFILAILAILIFCIAYYTENAKNKGQEFLAYLTKDQYIVEMVKGDGEKFKDGEKNLSLVFVDGTESSGIDFNIVADDSNLDGIISIKAEEEEMNLIEFIKEDKTFAFNIPELNEEFIAINDKDLLELGEKFGFDVEVFKDEKGNEEAKQVLESLYKRYSKTLAKAISKHIKVDKNENVEIDEEKYKADLYRLDIDTKTFAEIYSDILSVLAEDEEAIAFLAGFISAQDGSDFEDVYEELTETFAEQKLAFAFSGLISEEDNEEILKLHIYVKDGKAIKTQLTAYNDYEEAKMALEAIGNDKKDFVKFSVEDYEEASIIYRANKNDDGIDCEIIVGTTDGETSKMEVLTKTSADKSREVRKLKDVDYLLLNEATDEELNTVCETYFGMSLEDFKEMMVKNDSEYEDDYDFDSDYTFDDDFKYKEGEFKLYEPDKQVMVLDTVKEAYDKIEFGMKKEEVQAEMKKLGLKEDNLFEDSLYYYLGDISIIGVRFDKVGVTSVSVTACSDKYDNVQISKELGTKIDDLTVYEGKIKDEMKKDEVIKILGNNYLETFKDDYGYSSIKWYDKNENIIEVDFDDDGLAYYVSSIGMDF